VQALRDIDCVHNAWAHRLDENPARVDYLNAQQTVDCGGHAMIHTAMRVLFMVSAVKVFATKGALLACNQGLRSLLFLTRTKIWL